MRMTQILGGVALVIGLVLLGFAYHASNAPMDQVSNAITGRFTDQTMWYLILGHCRRRRGCPASRIRQTEIECDQAPGPARARSLPEGGNERRARR